VHPAYCAHCGQPADARDHEACQQAGLLDPPRYCAHCGRRMVVKVTPDRWTASCSRHGHTDDASR
jgi:DNA-directed RNA polymerase subunit RPC12/RpoP